MGIDLTDLRSACKKCGRFGITPRFLLPAQSKDGVRRAFTGLGCGLTSKPSPLLVFIFIPSHAVGLEQLQEDNQSSRRSSR
jgi:hypothetical protein